MKFIAIAVVATIGIGRACAASQRKRSTENKYTTASERRDVRSLDPYLGLAERKLEEIMSMDNHDNDGDGEK